MKPQPSAVGLNTVVMALTNVSTRNALVSLEPQVSQRQPVIQDAFRNGIENFALSELESTVPLFASQPAHVVAVCVDPQQFSVLESIANKFFSGYVVHAAGWFLAQSLGTIENIGDDKVVIVASDTTPVVSEKVSWYDPMANPVAGTPTAKTTAPVVNIKVATSTAKPKLKSPTPVKVSKTVDSEKIPRARKPKPVAVSTYVVPSREEIKQLRERLSLTQSAAAKQMGIARSCITEMERGREKRATDAIRWRIFSGLQKIANDQGLIV
jgi:DNA-binding transcriptional regulator YiaG